MQNGGDSDDSDSERDDFEGLKVKPRKGDALLFYTFKPDGTHDKVTETDHMMFETPSSSCPSYPFEFRTVEGAEADALF
jgi:hypothetical protein